MTLAQVRYRFLLYALWPLLAIFVSWLAIRYRDQRFLLQRMGFRFPPAAVHPIWIHAASVGEVIAAIPLVRAIRYTLPDHSILITTTTPTGALTAQNKLGLDTEICYLPIDWPYAVTAFLKRYQPRCALIMETEIWPNLYNRINRLGVPLLIVNARLSSRTLNAPRWVLNLYADSLDKVTRVLARSQLDADRYLELGCRPEKIHVIGNIKFSAEPVDIRALTPIISRPYVLLASTHADEEQRIAQQWLTAGLEQLLVIAPRHPVRSTALVRELSEITASLAVRSRDDEITPQTRIYLADTLGEMANLMTFADIVVMGGSFIRHGGQNILEPARLGKAILTGPSMENFAEECAKLLEAEALIQCQDVTELIKNLQSLLRADQRRQTLGENAKTVMQKHAGIADLYLAQIKPYTVPE